MHIELREKIASGAAFVTPILLRHLERLPHAPSADHALSARGLSVGVAISRGALVGEPPCGARITIQAPGTAATWFPIFTGMVFVEVIDELSSRLVLSGAYDVPFGPLGALADRTIFAGAADESLRGFLAAVKDDVAAQTLAGVFGSERPT